MRTTTPKKSNTCYRLHLMAWCNLHHWAIISSIHLNFQWIAQSRELMGHVHQLFLWIFGHQFFLWFSRFVWPKSNNHFQSSPLSIDTLFLEHTILCQLKAARLESNKWRKQLLKLIQVWKNHNGTYSTGSAPFHVQWLFLTVNWYTW